ncbi:hypothetical protein FA09DRAFT_154151 [Tilletiopsis washingtonensis]|uniref:Uncharacterized protein n=1 Tax=Tilletiopsis washingtonensis TaxID=58919 RepID=A0A316Z2L9_9BASI|nr:hypothetical protein FA09DRAFT_154151 [Tilletiopsis washingtonensis]PWN95208.1 hypothetical protein FA09DRAFT_154151 [Tilletiopsis washingtonensis]
MGAADHTALAAGGGAAAMGAAAEVDQRRACGGKGGMSADSAQMHESSRRHVRAREQSAHSISARCLPPAGAGCSQQRQSTQGGSAADVDRTRPTHAFSLLTSAAQRSASRGRSDAKPFRRMPACGHARTSPDAEMQLLVRPWPQEASSPGPLCSPSPLQAPQCGGRARQNARAMLGGRPSGSLVAELAARLTSVTSSSSETELGMRVL